MKKLMACGMILASAAAMAVESSNIFGILRVDSTEKETIISVPWIQADSVTADIKVADLVLTSNLSIGDQLYYYNGNASFQYEGWQLTEGTVGGEATKVWTPMTQVSHDGITFTEAAENKSAIRGAALFVVRPTFHTDPIYLYGRYATGTAETTVAQGSPETKTSRAVRAHTLLAPSNPNGADLNATNADGSSKYMAGTPGKTDFIMIEPGKPLVYRNLDGSWKWGVYTQTGRTSYTWNTNPETTTIKHGQGCWYVSEGGAPTFKW